MNINASREFGLMWVVPFRKFKTKVEPENAAEFNA
jgi:hypothetical protein